MEKEMEITTENNFPPALSKGCSKYGAQMGRISCNPDPDFQGTVFLEPILDPCPNGDGAYDYEGAYWGAGDMVYRAVYYQDGWNEFFIREQQRDPDDARNAILAMWRKMPKATPQVIDPIGGCKAHEGDPCEWCLENETEKNESE